MKRTVDLSCSTAVTLFRGLYARVGRELGVDASYISRVARGERKSEVAEKALNHEFRRVLALTRNSAARTRDNRRRRIWKNIRKKS